jgi:hypothetical protein
MNSEGRVRTRKLERTDNAAGSEPIRPPCPDRTPILSGQRRYCLSDVVQIKHHTKHVWLMQLVSLDWVVFGRNWGGGGLRLCEGCWRIADQSRQAKRNRQLNGNKVRLEFHGNDSKRKRGSACDAEARYDALQYLCEWVARRSTCSIGDKMPEASREQKLLGAEVFYGVPQFGGLFEFEFFGGFAHVGFQVGYVGVEVGLGGEVGEGGGVFG